jgi:hypothetical protein
MGGERQTHPQLADGLISRAKTIETPADATSPSGQSRAVGEVVAAGDDEPIASLQVRIAGGPVRDRHWQSPDAVAVFRPGQANGRMFWFMRKKFFGSYFVLSSWRRR